MPPRSAAHHAQPGRGLNDLLRHLRLGAHDHGLDLGDEGDEVRLLERFLQHRDLEFRARPEERNALGRNRVANQYVHNFLRE